MSEAMSLADAIALVTKAKQIQYETSLKLAAVEGGPMCGPPGCRGYNNIEEVLEELKSIEANMKRMETRILQFSVAQLSIVSEEISAIAHRLNIVKV